MDGRAGAAGSKPSCPRYDLRISIQTILPALFRVLLFSPRTYPSIKAGADRSHQEMLRCFVLLLYLRSTYYS